jgi:hypothetical protein
MPLRRRPVVSPVQDERPVMAPDHPIPSSLIAAFSDIAQQVYSSEDDEASMRRITETATTAIAGCDAASLTVLERAGPDTRAATHEVARNGDLIQFEEGEGPCLDAAMHERWVYTADLGSDPRWPRSAARLRSELGVGSMLSLRLALDAAPSKTLGGLNLYSSRQDGFGEKDQMLGILLSSLGAVVVDAARQQAHLRAAIESRQVIGEAIGILRAHDPALTRDDAFSMLSAASQRMNLKLRELARRIADHEVLPEE